MADLDPAHVEAVAGALVWPASRHDNATELLTSTDPAVHAALLAALVRAGVMGEEVRNRCESCGSTFGFCQNIDSACDDAEWIDERRYVTRWEDVDE